MKRVSSLTLDLGVSEKEEPYNEDGQVNRNAWELETWIPLKSETDVSFQ